MWRNQLNDVGILYSLVDDLQTFWQFKALEWDKLQLRVRQVAEEERRAQQLVKSSPEERLREILENNEDFRVLRDRLVIALKSASEIAYFLNHRDIGAIQHLTFDPPLPPNELLEAAIVEAEALARDAQAARYWWRILLRPLFGWRRLLE